MIIFVSGSGTGVGKTTITTRIATHLKRDFVVSIAKPIETGVESVAQDAELHRRTQSTAYNIDEICFYRFALPASPFVADTKGIIDISEILARLRALEGKCDVLFVEGAGGLFVPIKKEYFMLDLIADLGAFCVLVAQGNLGCINEILSARYILQSRGIGFVSVVNAFKGTEADFELISAPFLRDLERNFIYHKDKTALMVHIARLIRADS